MSDDPSITPDPAVTPPAAAATPPPATPPTETWDEERARATIQAQRESEKTLKAELAEARKAQDKLAEIEAANLSDQEKAAKELEDAKARAAKGDEALRRGLLLAELSKPEHGIVDAEAAAALIQGVEYGDDHRPTNAVERITALLEAKGFLKATPGTVTPPSAPNIDAASGTGGGPPPKLSPEEIRMAERSGMSPDEYAAFRDADTLDDLTKAGLTKQPAQQ